MDELPNYSINISKLPSASKIIELPMDKAILTILAQECGVVAFETVSTKFRLKRYRKHGVTIFGEFAAKVEQECISTLEPVISQLNESFERQFLPPQDTEYKMPEIIDGEMILDPEASDIPDIIEGGEINLWDVLLEELILVIDLFPRAGDLVSEDIEIVETKPSLEQEQTHRPFSDLKALITEKKSNK